MELTCLNATNDAISSYEWRKDNVVVANTTAEKYQLPDNKRANSGSYQCKVVAVNAPPSTLADSVIVTFMCKYLVYLLATKWLNMKTHLYIT